MAIRILDMFCGMSAFRTAAEQLGGFSFVGYCDNGCCSLPHPIPNGRRIFLR